MTVSYMTGLMLGSAVAYFAYSLSSTSQSICFHPETYNSSLPPEIWIYQPQNWFVTTETFAIFILILKHIVIMTDAVIRHFTSIELFDKTTFVQAHALDGISNLTTYLHEYITFVILPKPFCVVWNFIKVCVLFKYCSCFLFFICNTFTTKSGNLIFFYKQIKSCRFICKRKCGLYALENCKGYLIIKFACVIFFFLFETV